MNHKNFKILGVNCTKTDGVYFMYTKFGLTRMRTTSLKSLWNSCIKYRLGFKEWYK